jgi:hypothetical protein
LVNPNPKLREDDVDRYVCDNESLLKQVAAFTQWRSENDHQESVRRTHPNEPTETERYHDKMASKIGPKTERRFENWPLNRPVFDELADYCRSNGVQPSDPRRLEAFAVPPLRSQMRAVIIFAVQKKKSDA